MGSFFKNVNLYMQSVFKSKKGTRENGRSNFLELSFQKHF